MKNKIDAKKFQFPVSYFRIRIEIFLLTKIEMSGKQTVIHWFRKGLRLHDNPALVEAINKAISVKGALRAIFILDPTILKW